MSEDKVNADESAANVGPDTDKYAQRALVVIQRTVVETLISVEYMAKLASMLLQSKSFVAFIRPIITDVVQQILAEERQKQKEAVDANVDSN